MLGIDASTAGRRLVAIERDLDAVLFSRAKSGLSPTEAGEIAIQQAIEIERRADRLSERLPGRSAKPVGSVRLNSNPWVLTQLANLALADLHARFPGIELIMIVGKRHRSIATGKTDLALWFEVDPADGEFAIPLGNVQYALYAPKGIDADKLNWVTTWDVEERIEPMRWLEDRLPADHQMALKSDDPPALLGAIAAGLGKGLIPVCLGDRDDRVVRIHGEIPDFHRRISLHAHPDLVQSPKIQSTMAWVRENFDLVFGDPPASAARASHGGQ